MLKSLDPAPPPAPSILYAGKTQAITVIGKLVC
jgi:hypothetical protein